MPKVTLIACTPSPERTVAAAAKLCYAGSSLDELMDSLTDDAAAGFVEMLGEIGHESPIEHASFTFGLEGVSRALLAEITRHRIASFSVQSQRYVRKDSFMYVTPPEIAEIPEAAAEYQAAMDAAQKSYNKLAGILKARHIERLTGDGLDEKAAARQAEKSAIEDARFVLPNACDTKMIVTMNARSLHNFFSLRCCSRAQWEIRGVADQMLALVCEAAPNLFSKAGPSCVSGACSEGKMTCGKAAEVRERIAALKARDKGRSTI